MSRISLRFIRATGFALSRTDALPRGDDVAGASRTHINRDEAHRLVAGVDAEMHDVHRLHQRVAGLVCALALVAVIDRQFALEDIGEHRDAVPVRDGARAGRDGDDRGRDLRIARRITDCFAHDGLVGGEQRHGGIGGRRRLGQAGRRRAEQGQKAGTSDQDSVFDHFPSYGVAQTGIGVGP